MLRVKARAANDKTSRSNTQFVTSSAQLIFTRRKCPCFYLIKTLANEDLYCVYFYIVISRTSNLSGTFSRSIDVICTRVEESDARKVCTHL